jgi:hypothetical protein
VWPRNLFQQMSLEGRKPSPAAAKQQHLTRFVNANQSFGVWRFSINPASRQRHHNPPLWKDNNTTPLPPTSEARTMVAMSTNGGVLAEWTALVHRERMMAYHMSPVKAKRVLPGTSPASAAVDHIMEDDSNISLPCPAAWREKIVEWCFQVVDHW